MCPRSLPLKNRMEAEPLFSYSSASQVKDKVPIREDLIFQIQSGIEPSKCTHVNDSSTNITVNTTRVIDT